MKVVILNNNLVWGGAYRSAKNTEKALANLGIDINFLDYTAYAGNFKKFFFTSKHYLDRLSLRLYKNRIKPLSFSPGNWGINIKKFRAVKNADIINLHWITGGFISLSSLNWLISLNKPVVWTIHDFWPVTGGCHVNMGCEKFKDMCGKCLLLGSGIENDLSRKGWHKKKKLYSSNNLHIVTGSSWMAEQIKSSSLMKQLNVDIFLNPIDTKVFNPGNKAKSREKLGLPKDKFIIITGGMGIINDRNKGFADFIEAVNIFSARNKSIEAEFIIFGNDSEEIHSSQFPFRIQATGKIENDHLLADYYSAADVFICASKQEVGPITVLESIACGTPVVSYPVGEVPQIIEHKKDGYIAWKGTPTDMADGLDWVIKNDKDKISDILQEKAFKCFSFEAIGNKYKQLFEEIIKNP